MIATDHGMAGQRRGFMLAMLITPRGLHDEDDAEKVQRVARPTGRAFRSDCRVFLLGVDRQATVVASLPKA